MIIDTIVIKEESWLIALANNIIDVYTQVFKSQ